MFCPKVSWPHCLADSLLPLVLVLKEDDSKAEREDCKFLKAAANDVDESSLSPCFATPVEALKGQEREERCRKKGVCANVCFMRVIKSDLRLIQRSS